MINTKQHILSEAKSFFAVTGYEGFSIRNLTKHCDVSLSSIYHFFDNKDALLQQIFYEVGVRLGEERSKLVDKESASEMLRDRILFQFEHIEDVVFVLKYYLHFRDEFKEHADGHLPPKAYLHIKEVLKRGIDTGEFAINEANVEQESKVIAHAINGFLLEYYPSRPVEQDLESLVDSIHQFLVRSLTNKEAVMN